MIMAASKVNIDAIGNREHASIGVLPPSVKDSLLESYFL